MEFYNCRFIIVLLLGVFSDLGFVVKASVLDDCPVVAAKSKKGISDLLTCNLSSIKENRKYFPLSELVENFEIVRLDNADGALVDISQPVVTDNYILIKSSRQIPYKLFTRSGKFVATIGNFGQGPGEYTGSSDCQLDEENKCIYILPRVTDKILVYDLQGKSLPVIPLCQTVRGGKFRVNIKESYVICSSVPYAGKVQNVIFKQDLKGNFVHAIPSGNRAVQGGESPQVERGGNTKDYGFYLKRNIIPIKDTLYTYNHNKNELLPRFTVKYPDKDKLPPHEYIELPNHFIGWKSELKQMGGNTYKTVNLKYFIIDKRKLKGTYFYPYIDFLGNLYIYADPSYFCNGYYAYIVEPVRLRENLETMLRQSPKLETRLKEQAQKLIPTLKENDNNVILLGKLKGY